MPLEQVEIVAEALRVVAPAGVSIEDPVTLLGPEEGFRLDWRRPAVVKAYLPVDDGLGERLEQLDAALAVVGLRPELTTRTVQEEDWADAWKEHFQIERFGERIVIRPTWRPYTPRPDDIVIDLDPGMAFGTGQHPTTRMCLELLEQLVQPADLLLDIGTGSGILAIAGVKVGAGRCLACDLEARSVQVARENITANGVSDYIQVETGTLEHAPGAGGVTVAGIAAPRSADLVVANISAAAIMALAPAFAGALRDGGRLIASGVIGEREAEVLAALTAAGLTIDAVRAGGDWRAIVARRG